MRSRRSRALATVTAVLALAGCADYHARRDAVTLGAGNALETNKAIHADAAFPPNADDTVILRDGKSAANAMDGYYEADGTLRPTTGVIIERGIE